MKEQHELRQKLQAALDHIDTLTDIIDEGIDAGASLKDANPDWYKARKEAVNFLTRTSAEFREEEPQYNLDEVRQMLNENIHTLYELASQLDVEQPKEREVVSRASALLKWWTIYQGLWEQREAIDF